MQQGSRAEMPGAAAQALTADARIRDGHPPAGSGGFIPAGVGGGVRLRPFSKPFPFLPPFVLFGQPTATSVGSSPAIGISLGRPPGSPVAGLKTGPGSGISSPKRTQRTSAEQPHPLSRDRARRCRGRPHRRSCGQFRITAHTPQKSRHRDRNRTHDGTDADAEGTGLAGSTPPGLPDLVGDR
jgi:hypothetical protein